MVDARLPDSLEAMMVIRQAKVLLGARVAVVHAFFFILTLLWGAFFEALGPQVLIRVFITINLLEVAVLVYAVVRWHNHFYLLRPDKILTSRGVFLRQQRLFAIRNIESISVHQGVMGKLFDYGTVRLYAPRLNQQVTMSGVHDPCRKERIIESLLPNAHNPEQKLKNVLMVPKR